MDLYTDNDPNCCAWLRELVKADELPAGDVLEADIRDLRGEQLAGYRRVHHFGGIGGWGLALHLAGWPSDRPVWTGSCPCQPFSQAGKRRGQVDDRHLWPMLLRLIRECRPPTLFGEQVSGPDGYEWLARVRDDLEAEGYAVGCADLPACSQAAPHRRSRLFFVADAGQSPARVHKRPGQADAAGEEGIASQPREKTTQPPRRGSIGGMGNAGSKRRQQNAGSPSGHETANGRAGRHRGEPDGDNVAKCAGTVSELGDAESGIRQVAVRQSQQNSPTVEPRRPGRPNFWSAFGVVICRDPDEHGQPKARRVEPGTFPLAHGIPGRVAALRGYGNAIVPAVAAEFVTAFLEAEMLV